MIGERVSPFKFNVALTNVNAIVISFTWTPCTAIELHSVKLLEYCNWMVLPNEE